MKIADGIEMLPVTVTMQGRQNTINLTLLRDERGAILVDAGYPGMTDALRQAVEEAGVPFESLDTVIVTHHDIDHIGGLPDLLAALPDGVRVLASEVEKPHVQGEKRPIKVTPERIERALASLPPDTTEEQRKAFRNRLEHPPSAPVSATIAGGQEIDRAGGIVVVDTPGHTPGHISLYHRPSRTLIAGDAMRVVDGRLEGPGPEMTYDVPQAIASLRNIAPYDVRNVICYHGGFWSGDGNARIRELAAAAEEA